MSKKVYVLLADGFEIVEAMTPVDVLRRGGADLKTVSITNSKEVISSHNIKVMADITIFEQDIKDGDLLVIPGGYPGYENLGKSVEVGEVVKHHAKGNRLVGAICGAPTVLAKNGVFLGKTLTSHSSVKDEMKDYNYTGADVEVDENLITGIGAGYALDFSLALAKKLFDDEIISKIKKGMELK